jgi:hypothetical protein
VNFLGLCKRKPVRLALARVRHSSVRHLERRAVFRPRPAVIIDPRGGNIRVPEPFLNLGDVGLVIERIGGGRRAQRMRADLESELRRIGPHQLVDAIRGDRAF